MQPRPAARYDRIGRDYARTRREDPRFAARIRAALGAARNVVNVGAGAGSYEPNDRAVLAVEPSLVMLAQRDPRRAPAVRARAGALPFADGAVDAAMAILTVHHWDDEQEVGVRELRRVARGPVVVLTYDPRLSGAMWLMADYLPEVAALDHAIFPLPERIAGWLGGTVRIETVPIPRDTPDWMLGSFWAHPERVADAAARAATSGFARMPPAVVARVVAAVRRDLASGAWDARHGRLRSLAAHDVGLRLIVGERDHSHRPEEEPPMIQQAVDFRDESDALYQALAPLAEADFERRTQFKGWTVHDVISHLHVWNRAADLSLADPEAFADFRTKLLGAIANGRRIRDVEGDWLDGARNRARLEQWREFYLGMADRFAAADPKRRVAWAGPDMSVRSSISARLMETWAHGQEVYDLLGCDCAATDRLRNIADLGVRTFGWAYANRGRAVPTPAPAVRLTAPSGGVWEWNAEETENRVEGPAVDFCRVVTQTRNVADTALAVHGPVAHDWMTIVQCFAGPPEDPPAPGTRFVASTGRAQR